MDDAEHDSGGPNSQSVLAATTFVSAVLAGSVFYIRKHFLKPQDASNGPSLDGNSSYSAHRNSHSRPGGSDDAKDSKSVRSKDRRRRGKDPLKELLKGGKKAKEIEKQLDKLVEQTSSAEPSRSRDPSTSSSRVTAPKSLSEPESDDVYTENDEGDTPTELLPSSSSPASIETISASPLDLIENDAPTPPAAPPPIVNRDITLTPSANGDATNTPRRVPTPSRRSATPFSNSSTPPPSGSPSLSTQTQIASLKGALEAARLREQNFKAEIERFTKEVEMLRWESSVSRRREVELQTQMQQLVHQLHAYTSFFQQAQAGAPHLQIPHNQNSPPKSSSPNGYQQPLPSPNGMQIPMSMSLAHLQMNGLGVAGMNGMLSPPSSGPTSLHPSPLSPYFGYPIHPHALGGVPQAQQPHPQYPHARRSPQPPPPQQQQQQSSLNLYSLLFPSNSGSSSALGAVSSPSSKSATSGSSVSGTSSPDSAANGSGRATSTGSPSSTPAPISMPAPLLLDRGRARTRTAPQNGNSHDDGWEEPTAGNSAVSPSSSNGVYLNGHGYGYGYGYTTFNGYGGSDVESYGVNGRGFSHSGEEDRGSSDDGADGEDEFSVNEVLADAILKRPETINLTIGGRRKKRKDTSKEAASSRNGDSYGGEILYEAGADLTTKPETEGEVHEFQFPSLSDFGYAVNERHTVRRKSKSKSVPPRADSVTTDSSGAHVDIDATSPDVVNPSPGPANGPLPSEDSPATDDPTHSPIS